MAYWRDSGFSVAYALHQEKLHALNEDTRDALRLQASLETQVVAKLLQRRRVTQLLL